MEYGDTFTGHEIQSPISGSQEPILANIIDEIINIQKKTNFNNEIKKKKATKDFINEFVITNNFLLALLLESYKEQKVKYSDHIKGYENNSDRAFYLISDKFYFIKINKIKVALTDSPSLFFQVQESKEIFFDSDLFEVAFSIYHDNKLLARNIGEVENIFEEIEELINQYQYKSIDFDYTNSPQHELSTCC